MFRTARISLVRAEEIRERHLLRERRSYFFLIGPSVPSLMTRFSGNGGLCGGGWGTLIFAGGCGGCSVAIRTSLERRRTEYPLTP